MAKIAGRELLLKLEDSPGAGTYTTIANIVDLNFTVNNAVSDSTNKDSNGWQELLQNGSTKNVNISLTAILTKTTEQDTLLSNIFNGTISNFQILYADDNSTVTGAFQGSNLNVTGGTEGDQRFDVTLDSSGEITFA